VLIYLARRLAQGAVVVLLTAIFAYGGIRYLRPELYGGESWLDGTTGDLRRFFLHLDFGESCMYVGCPKIHDLWTRGVFVDLALLAGALLIGAVGGSLLGAWCAGHRGSVAARFLEAMAMLFFCAPVYVVGYLALLTFDPYFGVLPIHILIDPNRFGEPFANVHEFFTGMALPWLICAAPIGAACLRLTIALTTEARDEDYVRTAIAKGLPPRKAVRKHAGPVSRVSVASYIGAAIPAIVLNMVLVEFVFAVPGFFKHTWRAFGKSQGYPPAIDYPTLQAIGVWAAILIAIVSILADIAVTALDPRIRATGRA
jgi:peptide/nickel transport system permease protein